MSWGISRDAVVRHLRNAANEAKAPLGSDASNQAKRPPVGVDGRVSKTCQTPSGRAVLASPFGT